MLFVCMYSSLLLCIMYFIVIKSVLPIFIIVAICGHGDTSLINLCL